MNITDFILIVLIKEIGHIQGPPGEEEGHKYLSFGLMCQGIELLGALCDSKDISVENQSRARFNLAITNFFPAQYHSYAVKGNAFDLYKNLRCGMLHIGAPGSAIALGELGGTTLPHLHVTSGPSPKLILVAETLYSDFCAACREVIRLIMSGELYTKFPELANASQEKRDVIGLVRPYLTVG